MYLTFNVLDHPSFNFISIVFQNLFIKILCFFVRIKTFGEGKPVAWHLRDTVDPFFTTSSPVPGCLVSEGATERKKINEKNTKI